ncbi:hypothetical protein ACIA2T_29050 [Amycolatopsis japonica]|uniref:AbiTii domain-containing protein n=1 Tax=Amycolatopsis japonica TaxID=208439 RepID=UPI003788C37A
MLSRQNEALSLAKDLLADIELTRAPVSKTLMKAMRLARLSRNSEAQVWLGYEINGVPKTSDGRAWMDKTGRWDKQEEEVGYLLSAPALEAHRSSAASVISVMDSTSLSGEWVLVANRDRIQNINSYARVVSTVGAILAQVEALIYEFVSETYHELMFSELQASLFEDARAAIDGRLTSLTGDVLRKIDSISERLRDDDEEAISQAMSTCRRLVDAVADGIFPAHDKPYMIGEQELSVKHNNVQNRINAYVHRAGIPRERAARIRRSLGDIYGRLSASVHGNVSAHEARYLFLGTYVLLGEVLTLDETTVFDVNSWQ